jgi:hypothetical protein
MPQKSLADASPDSFVTVPLQPHETVEQFVRRRKRSGRAALRYMIRVKPERLTAAARKTYVRRALFLWLTLVDDEYFLCDDFITHERADDPPDRPGDQPYGFCETVPGNALIATVLAAYDQHREAAKRIRRERNNLWTPFEMISEVSVDSTVSVH